MRQAVCPGRELARLCAAVLAVGKAELPWGALRQQNCGYSSLVRPNGLPPKGQREPAAPRGASGELELERADSQSGDPSAGPLSLSGVRAPVAAGRGGAASLPSEYGCVPPLLVRAQTNCYSASPHPVLQPSPWHGRVLYRPARVGLGRLW